MINTEAQGPKSSTQTQSLVLRVSAVARVFGRVHKQSDIWNLRMEGAMLAVSFGRVSCVVDMMQERN